MTFHILDLDKLGVIHVSGTKGKGSTCAFTESILRQRGLKTGLFTSPHLLSGMITETQCIFIYFHKQCIIFQR